MRVAMDSLPFFPTQTSSCRPAAPKQRRPARHRASGPRNGHRTGVRCARRRAEAAGPSVACRRSGAGRLPRRHRRQRLCRARCRTARRRLAAGAADRTAARLPRHRRAVAARARAGPLLAGRARLRVGAAVRARRAGRIADPALPAGTGRRRRRSRARAVRAAGDAAARPSGRSSSRCAPAHLGALVGWLPHTCSSREGEFRAMRRLQLLAGRQQAPVFLLRDARALHAPSPAALRLQLAARDGGNSPSRS